MRTSTHGERRVIGQVPAQRAGEQTRLQMRNEGERNRVLRNGVRDGFLLALLPRDKNGLACVVGDRLRKPTRPRPTVRQTDALSRRCRAGAYRADAIRLLDDLEESERTWRTGRMVNRALSRRKPNPVMSTSRQCQFHSFSGYSPRRVSVRTRSITLGRSSLWVTPNQVAFVGNTFTRARFSPTSVLTTVAGLPHPAGNKSSVACEITEEILSCRIRD